MSWLTRVTKSKEKPESESSQALEERGLLEQAMLEHGRDPWDPKMRHRCCCGIDHRCGARTASARTIFFKTRGLMTSVN
eukprot:XP_027314127.1 uncharacterized protein LOC106017522 isoform X2 [Anas platyrhynchos]